MRFTATTTEKLHARLEFLRGDLRSSGIPEAALAIVLASALWLPAIVGGKAWPPALAFLVLAAGWTALHERRLGPLPLLLLIYIGIYAVAAVHGGSLSSSDFARYFLRPVAALAVAMLVVTAAQRQRALLLIALFVAVEIPITAAQAIENVVRYGREATKGADSVTGSLGPSQAGVVTLAALAVAALVAGMWLAGIIRSRHALVALFALLAVGVFASTRATVAFVAVIAVGIAAVAATFGRDRPPAVRLLALIATALVAVPIVYGATRAIYPDAYVGALSSQNVAVLGGAPAERRSSPKAGSATTPVGPVGVELLPGRFAQIRLAVRASLNSGLVVALIGRGPGASELDPRYHRAQDVPVPQRTGSTWIGRVLTDTGWLGLCAFAALVIWLATLGRAIWLEAGAATMDSALGATLPGIAALTAFGAVFATILDVRGYSAIFWIVAGIAISAASSTRRARADRTFVVR